MPFLSHETIHDPTFFCFFMLLLSSPDLCSLCVQFSLFTYFKCHTCRLLDSTSENGPPSIAAEYCLVSSHTIQLALGSAPNSVERCHAKDSEEV